MNKLSIQFENCYGIKKLNAEFKFNESQVNLVYARNGLMKTSFAKVFKNFQDGKENEIKDEIFGKEPVVKVITNNNTDIKKNEIFVIKSFDSTYESESIASLLINDEIKELLKDVLKLRTKVLKNLESISGLKVSKTSLGKTVYELEQRIIDDFTLVNKSFLQNINNFDFQDINYDFSRIKYSDIFDISVVKKIKSKYFQEKIREYLEKSDEIYSEYNFFEKGKFTLSKLKEVQKRLKTNQFFVKDNKIFLNGNKSASNMEELNNTIIEIESELHDTAEFKEIEKLLSDSKGMILKDIIENYPEVVEEISISNLDEFRKKIWKSYFKSIESEINDLIAQYITLQDQIEDINLDETLWKEAIKIFNSRFMLPFKMEIDNITSSIIGESLPKVVFSFCNTTNIEECDDNQWVKLHREELEEKDTLSQGEKRALYLLNIIFDIEKRKNENQKTLFVIDDIADSFDYKNKYAIVEYLKDISNIDNFYMIILSHNFDFYRTLSSRLDLKRDNKYHVVRINDGIAINKETYQNNPFQTWKAVMKAKTWNNIVFESIDAKKHIIALIPFVRNLIEYGDDKEINNFPGIKKDYILLTNLLHLKDKTNEITFDHLKKVYKEYIGNDDFDINVNNSDKVCDMILELATNYIYDNDIKLENKIILALAIRLNAEKYMKNIIISSSDTQIFKWKEKRELKTGNKNDFMTFLKNNQNQTRELYNVYKQIAEINEIKIMESVNIMTPENIHINSFMYEPIIDMDMVELISLNEKINNLLLKLYNT